MYLSHKSRWLFHQKRHISIYPWPLTSKLTSLLECSSTENINIELGRFPYVPQVEICKIIKNEISISPWPWPFTLKLFSPFKSPWQQIPKELDSMFLSVPDDEIFQAGLSNIENIMNLFKYANERRDMKMRCLRFIKGLPSTQQWRFHHKFGRNFQITKI
jgi:hypothetical protein